MRRLIVAAVVLAAVALWFWPFAGVYALAAAAAARDEPALEAHIDRPRLSRSLVRQIVSAYLAKTGRGNRLGPLERGYATEAGVSMAAPYLDQLLSSGALTALLDNGRIGSIRLGDRTIALDRVVPAIRGLTAAGVMRTILNSSYDGLLSFRLSLAEPDMPDHEFGIHLRLHGLTWRLSGIDLPSDTIDRIVADVLAAEHRRTSGS